MYRRVVYKRETKRMRYKVRTRRLQSSGTLALQSIERADYNEK